MRVLLIFPRIMYSARTDFHPIGLLSLAGYLEKHIPDIKMKFLDFNTDKLNDEEFLKLVADFEPDIIGASVSTLHYPHAAHVSEIARKRFPKIKIVWGGPHVELEMEECLESCDFALRGEAEQIFYELVTAIGKDENDFSRIKGISYKKDGKIMHNPPRERFKNIEDLPWPAYHLVDLKKYFEYPLVGVITNRGCPFLCTFCGTPARWGQMVVSRSVKNIVDEIQYLHEVHGANGIYFFDDIFNIPQQRAIGICDEIVRRGLNKEMYFQAQLRANKGMVSEELFRKLKIANFNKVSFGIESASQKVMDAMKKNLPIEDVERAIKMSQEAGLDTRGYFMIGNWDEGLADIWKTVRFIIKTGLPPSLCIAVPLPGTEFYNILKANGRLDPKKIDWGKATASIALVDTNKLKKWQINLIYKSIYRFFYLKKAYDLPLARKVDFLKKKLRSLGNKIRNSFEGDVVAEKPVLIQS